MHLLQVSEAEQAATEGTSDERVLHGKLWVLLVAEWIPALCCIGRIHSPATSVDEAAACRGQVVQALQQLKAAAPLLAEEEFAAPLELVRQAAPPACMIVWLDSKAACRLHSAASAAPASTAAAQLLCYGCDLAVRALLKKHSGNLPCCRAVDGGQNPDLSTRDLFIKGLQANQAAKGKVQAVQGLR